MRYLIDPNVWIRVTRDDGGALSRRVAEAAVVDGVVLTQMVKAELLDGVYHSRKPIAARHMVERIFERDPCVAFDDVAAEHHAQARVHLARIGLPIGPADLIIAATALSHGCVIVTHNVNEFKRVPGLRIQDWEAEIKAGGSDSDVG